MFASPLGNAQGADVKLKDTESRTDTAKLESESQGSTV